MCDVGNIILNSVLTFASVWIVRKFLDTFYEKKRWNVLSVSVWSIYIIFQGYVQFHSGDASTLTTIVNVLLCIMISAISYYGFGKNNIFLLTFFWAVWALVEMIIFFFLNLFCLDIHFVFCMEEKGKQPDSGKILYRIFLCINRQYLHCNSGVLFRK